MFQIKNDNNANILRNLLRKEKLPTLLTFFEKVFNDKKTIDFINDYKNRHYVEIYLPIEEFKKMKERFDIPLTKVLTFVFENFNINKE